MASSIRLLLACIVHILFGSASGGFSFLHHSRSLYGPWEPVIPDGCNASSGVWANGGGNNPSPVIIDEELAQITGLPANSIVIITMWANKSGFNRSHPNPNVSQRDYFAVGVAKSWRDPVIIDSRPLFFLPDQNNYLNDSCKTLPWDGWRSEDPYLYFDRQLQRWRALFHQARHCPPSDPPGARFEIGKHCGGYAESLSPDLWGRWRAHPPQLGAYTLDADFIPHGTGKDGRNNLQQSQAAAPFHFGKSYPAYMNTSMTTWGGNVILGEDGLYHLFVSGFGAAGPGFCDLGSWTLNSEVLHAIADSPIGPFRMHSVALPAWHTNPHITRAPDGEYLLYSVGCGYGSCKNCHKGRCGPYHCGPGHWHPLGPGTVTFTRRERPKFLFDKLGRPSHMYNGVAPYGNGGGPFTMVTEILASDLGIAYV